MRLKKPKRSRRGRSPTQGTVWLVAEQPALIFYFFGFFLAFFAIPLMLLSYGARADAKDAWWLR
jgi:hypothetical protein